MEITKINEQDLKAHNRQQIRPPVSNSSSQIQQERGKSKDGKRADMAAKNMEKQKSGSISTEVSSERSQSITQARKKSIDEPQHRNLSLSRQ